MSESQRGDHEFRSEFTEKDLGMDRGITRRDFVDGFAVAAAGAALSGGLAGAALKPSKAKAKSSPGKSSPGGATGKGPQPPAELGMRGTNEEAYNYLDQLLSGNLNVGNASSTGEDFDLVVVGAGISGLAAAYFYKRDVYPDAKILIVDPHSDFGGHAMRNEFLVAEPGRRGPGAKRHRRIATAGSSTADNVVASQGDWADYGMGEAKTLLDEIGMNYTGQGGSTPTYPFPSGGPSRTLWMKEVWDAPNDVFQLGLSATEQINQSPMAEVAKQQRLALNTAGNWLSHLAPADRAALLKQYNVGPLLADLGPQYIAGFNGQPLHKHVLRHLYNNGGGGLGWGYAQLPAFECAAAQPQVGVGSALAAGFNTIPGENYPAQPMKGLAMTDVLRWNSVGGTVQWVGGNSMIARHLIAHLVPDALQASTDEEFITAHTDYRKLDQPRNQVKVRLQATVVRAEHGSKPKESSDHVNVTYVDHASGRMRQVRTRHLFFGCWNAAIPSIAPEMPQIKRKALADAVKMPIEATRICLTNYQAFMEAGVPSTSLPGNYYPSMGISRGAVHGDPARPYYQDSAGPDKPVMMSLGIKTHATGLKPDGTLGRWTNQEANRRGREALLSQSFSSIERRIRDNLTRAMQGTSFDPARDIGAIAVNRWQHGYMRWYSLPNDAAFWKNFGVDLLPTGDTPNKIGSAPFGRMTIGTTDAIGHGFIESSIMAAYDGMQYLASVD